MYNLRKVEVDIGGRRYQITSDDTYLEHIKGGFEPETVSLLRVLATDSSVILDIGANIGCTALLFGELSKFVYAYEPSKTTFNFLKINIVNAEINNIFLHNIGLGDQAGDFTLTFNPANRSGGFVSNQISASDGHTTENIVVSTLDEEVNKLRLKKIDFIKIDVEGFEGHVLRGATNSLRNFKPKVLLELNHWCLNAFQRTCIPDFFDYLRSIFPILLAVDGDRFLDLHNTHESYVVMYHHILHMKFPNIIGAFHQNDLSVFKKCYQHNFTD